MKCNFEIKELAPKSVIYCRHLGAVYLDDTQITAVDKLQSDVFLVVDAAVKVERGIGKYTIDGGKYAVGRFEIEMSEFLGGRGVLCVAWSPNMASDP